MKLSIKICKECSSEISHHSYYGKNSTLNETMVDGCVAGISALLNFEPYCSGWLNGLGMLYSALNYIITDRKKRKLRKIKSPIMKEMKKILVRYDCKNYYEIT